MPPPCVRAGNGAARPRGGRGLAEGGCRAKWRGYEATPRPSGGGGAARRWRRSRGRAQTRSWRNCWKDSLFASQERFFQELFDGELASQASAEFERAMKELAEEEPHLVEQFQKLSEAAGRVGGDAASQQEFTSCLKETLSGLARNATDLQGSAASEEDLAKAMEGLGLEEGSGEGGVLPVVQSVLQHLLSRDVLYPSLKEITDKLEAERPEDSEGDRRARFEAVLELMQQLQELGHPPKELAGEAPPGFNLDLEGLTLPEATGEQCRVM
ncbi:peroxisomal biogenesis factor 19 isoform X3 [Meleagris gallopavo]|uniref:peroxisomal biogenesis factor 19 isoform X3 n=1 Tax=Meleagris gallopavo TaxID=9103 RepID=UPI00093B6584|nr:peroxisomal biogenesis factor 19 isoform X3 [Meleagris gallopavo]